MIDFVSLLKRVPRVPGKCIIGVTRARVASTNVKVLDADNVISWHTWHKRLPRFTTASYSAAPIRKNHVVDAAFRVATVILAAAVGHSDWRLNLSGHESEVTSAAFSPDGARIVTASWDETARIWDAATGKEITVLRGHESEVTSAAFSPDGARIVTASWDTTG